MAPFPSVYSIQGLVSCFTSVSLFVFLESVFPPRRKIMHLWEVSYRPFLLHDQIMSVFFL